MMEERTKGWFTASRRDRSHQAQYPVFGSLEFSEVHMGIWMSNPLRVLGEIRDGPGVSQGAASVSICLYQTLSY